MFIDEEASGQGIMPGWPEWEYFFHGIGCRLTHRITGEEIETETGEGFDFFFWLRHLKSCESPDPATKRMIELHPSLESLRITLADLKAAGAIDSAEDAVHRFSVSEEAVDFTDVVEELLQVRDDQGAQDALRRLLEPNSPQVRGRHRRQRLSRVLDLLETKELGPEALFALSDLRPEDFADRLTKALFRTPYSGLNSVAMQIMEREDAAAWSEAAYRLWRTVNPQEAVPQPYLWIASAAFLLRHGHHTTEVLTALPLAGATDRGQAALLALEFGQDLQLAGRLFLDAFLKADSAPMSRIEAAAALAVLDSKWSRDILVSVLRQSTDAESTAEARVALRESLDPTARAAADEWEKIHLTSDDKETLWEGFVKHEIQEVHDRVRPLRC